MENGKNIDILNRDKTLSIVQIVYATINLVTFVPLAVFYCSENKQRRSLVLIKVSTSSALSGLFFMISSIVSLAAIE